MAAQLQPISGVTRSFKVRSNIGEELLAVAYLRMQAEGLLQQMFWQAAPSLREFLDWCHSPGTIVIGAFIEIQRPTLDAAPEVELAGLGWVHSVRVRNGARYADAGEVFWRKFQAMGCTLEMGRLMLDFAFQEVKVDALYGITPEKNIPAVRFMKHCGFQAFGPIPGLCCWNGQECGGYMSVLTRAAWEAKKHDA